ncbi:MAG: WYL domain-containing protein [Thermogemmatispora sp.]|uniref:helix-turn-helix transcriptional regulator n=1 Tax=Thermogemmatispora sp. TaxID=1968838 RepID=UPI0019F9DDF0|nr:WYL domain-containing protein [Thermogemmatispora sp.]MBE3567577.1 WYL domain-containing protein [Thermogemmatispora sp.]
MAGFQRAEPFSSEERLAVLRLERLLRLLALLRQGPCTRKQIFESLGLHYGIDREEATDDARLRRAHRTLERDLAILEEIGVVLVRERRGRQPARYVLEDDQGLVPHWSLSDTEVECLAFLASMFTDPYRLAPPDPTQALPQPQPRHPFADEVQALIERLARQLPPRQQQRFERWARTPYVYFNVAPVMDYLPYRELIRKIARAIQQHQHIRFRYRPLSGKEVTHQHLDPAYVIHMEGHFYLVAYHPERGQFLEFRIDRIQEQSLQIEPQLTGRTRPRQVLTFRFWLDARIAEPGLSQRWLSQVVEREEVRMNEQGQEERWILIRATAYSRWRVIQQLLRYGERAELIEPASLREEMRRIVSQMGRLYGLSMQAPEEEEQ